MKKYILIVLILIVLLQGCSSTESNGLINSSINTTVPAPTASTNATTVPSTIVTSNVPPISLGIRNEKEYNDLLQAAKNEQLYQENAMYTLVFDTHRELTEFVALLEKLPFPQIMGAKSNIKQLRVEHVIEQTNFYRFIYILDQDTASQNLKSLIDQKEILDKKVTINEQDKVSALTQFKVRWEDSKVYRCWLDMNGCLVVFETRNDQLDLSGSGIKEVFAPMTVENALKFPNSVVK